MLGINEAANTIGLQTTCARTTIGILCEAPLLVFFIGTKITMWFYIKKGVKFYVADPGKGLVTYNLNEFREHWISTRSNEEDKALLCSWKQPLFSSFHSSL